MACKYCKHLIDLKEIGSEGHSVIDHYEDRYTTRTIFLETEEPGQEASLTVRLKRIDGVELQKPVFFVTPINFCPICGQALIPSDKDSVIKAISERIDVFVTDLDI